MVPRFGRCMSPLMSFVAFVLSVAVAFDVEPAPINPPFSFNLLFRIFFGLCTLGDMLEYWSGKEKALVFGLIAALVVAVVLLVSPHIPALRPAAEALGMVVPVYKTVYINNTVPIYINRTVYLNRTVYINHTVPVYINRTDQEAHKSLDAGTCSGRIVVSPLNASSSVFKSWVAWIWLMPKSYLQRIHVEVVQYNSTSHVAKFRWLGRVYFVGGGLALQAASSCDIINATINGHYVAVCRGSTHPINVPIYKIYENGTLMAYTQLSIDNFFITVEVNYTNLMLSLGLNDSIIDKYGTMRVIFPVQPVRVNFSYTLMTALEPAPPPIGATSNSSTPVSLDVGPVCRMTTTVLLKPTDWWLPISEDTKYVEYLKDAFIQLQGHYDPRYGAIGYRG